MLARSKQTSLVVALAVVLVLCLAGSAVCVGTQTVTGTLPLPFGYVVSVCAVWQTTPRFQTGLAWQSPFFSAALPPFSGPGAGCFQMPWLPFLPQRGALLTP